MSLSSIHALRRSGNIAEAIRLCRELVERQPNDAEPLHLLGLLWNEAGDVEAALAWLRRSVELRPSEGRYHRNLAAVLAGVGKLAEAQTHARRAVELEPAAAEAHNNLGAVLEGMGRMAEAEGCYRRAAELRPDDARAIANLGNVLRSLGEVEQAEACHRRAIGLAPRLAAAHRGLGHDLTELGRSPEAVEAFRAALTLEPHSTAAHSDLLFAMHYCEQFSPSDLLEEGRRYGQRFQSIPTFKHSNQRDPNRKLRIGYLSPDFRRHTIPHVIEPVLRAHDRDHFEVFCYSAVRRPDEMTARLASLADHWINIAPLSDDAAAERIHADRIDVLVDLTGHMAGNRLPVFARRPAPVQMQLAYAGTTGLPAMGYKLSDPQAALAGAESQFTEKLIRLPETAWVYGTPDDCPPVRSLPAKSNGHVTFGCLNNPAKISDAAVAFWSQILQATPRSKLLLLSPVPNAHLLNRFAQLGIEPARIELTPRCPRQQYLELFHRIDIALDPLPYNGETTTCDGLWMGVPAITLAGQSMAARRGATILRNVGLGQLVSETAEQYVAIASSLASDLDTLAALRVTLRERMRSSPMTNGPRYTAALEGAYREVWQLLRADSGE